MIHSHRRHEAHMNSVTCYKIVVDKQHTD